MKYMKLGTKPDTFYTEEATRSIMTDVPTDLIIQVNNTKYLLHKCGLLQRLWSETDKEGLPAPILLLDLPGGEPAFELCSKFCYNITINLSAHNFIQAMAAAAHLQMTESVSRGNLILKLENFFYSCIHHGWKDSVVTLQNASFMNWNDDQRIIQTCLDSIVDKILTPPSQVTWSYTYTRPGFSRKKHSSAPRDWWTEDISDLNIDFFCSIIHALRSKKRLLSALIGEAIHVFVCKQLPDPDEVNSAQSLSKYEHETTAKNQRMLESVVSTIPAEPGSVSGKFYVKLLKIASFVGASPSVKAELVRGCGRQLDEIEPKDLIFHSPAMRRSLDTDIVEAIMENFLRRFSRPPVSEEESERRLSSMKRVAGIFDSYLEIIAHDSELSATKFLDLAVILPERARHKHDGLYQAIDTFIKEHPELSKTDRKELCRLIECHKLSAEARSHAIANDRMPLRTIVQLLYIQQDEASRGPHGLHKRHSFDPLNLHRRGTKMEAKEAGRAEKERGITVEPKVVKVAEASSNVVRDRFRGEGREDKKKLRDDM
ncbi:BTB/POZ domain-containing protein At5g47800 isoform X2 [Phalaenopsis equestris]|uniref:BTB/POZ domain-containing protein At5g47800 isoform X2 n=1 Tax=Phalaenopsis equestris TaxID=78828 RepID=UPI0009E41463|nr:BTB/POZ domain-containing protein At5g47800 isoform X2 [Phalaenopsis equestris]